MTLQAIHPATGETLSTYEEHTAEQIESKLRRADAAQREWRETDWRYRAGRMRQLAQALEDGAGDYAKLMAEEMGKPVSQGRSEAEKCAWVCKYYADHAADFLADQPIETDASKSYVTFQPLGLVLAIMPWNFPFWQVFRFAAPAIMAGNGGVLKHASNVPGCALAVEHLFQYAGFPQGLFTTLLIGSDRVNAVLEDERIRAATLTGSTSAGRKVAAAAGGLLKKTVLELGGSDAYVVLEDADVDKAAEICAQSRLINSGQSCIAAKRFVVVDAVLPDFEKALVRQMSQVKYGDPLDEDTELGPLARRDLRDELHEQVCRSREQGARCLLGGEVPDGPGAFYPPTVLADVRPGMPAYDDELFGPVAAILPASNEDEALRIANDSPYGLGAAVLTGDAARGEKIAAERLEAGCCFVNDFVRSDPRLPFGGVKNSGYGRELSAFGIREFVNVKTVYVR